MNPAGFIHLSDTVKNVHVHYLDLSRLPLVYRLRMRSADVGESRDTDRRSRDNPSSSEPLPGLWSLLPWVVPQHLKPCLSGHKLNWWL